MISVSDFRKGITIKLEDEVYSVIAFQHVKPGKGGAFLKTKLKNVKDGYIKEKTFRTEEKVKRVLLETPEKQYLYREGNKFCFMDNKTYEQMSLDKEEIGEGIKFLKENMNVDFLMDKGTFLGIELPYFVELKITQTTSGIKGNTVSGGSKPATLETGMQIQVPLFINVGDLIKVDTKTGEYVERV